MVEAHPQEMIERAELLDERSGVGLWSAVLHDRDAFHPDSAWRWSPEFRRLVGYQSLDEFPDMCESWSDRLHPEDAKRALAAFNAMFSSPSDDRRLDVTCRLKTANGEWRWFQATGGCRLRRDGLVLAGGALVDVHDLTVMKQNHRATENTLSLLRDVSGVGLWSANIVGADHRHPHSEWRWSPELLRLLGFESAHLFPDRFEAWADRIHPEDRGEALDALDELWSDNSGGGRYNVAYRIKTADGSYRWFRTTGGCSHQGDGTIHACGSMSDIHEAVSLRERIEEDGRMDALAFRQIDDAMQAVAEGDLTIRLPGGFPPKLNSLRNALNRMLEQTSEAIGHVKAGSEELTQEALAIADGARTLTDRAQGSAAAIEQTAAAIEQISGNISMNSDAARRADASAGTVKEKTDRGTEIVGNVILAMEEIETHTKQMSEITKVIEGFAFQTNLLSINAAVEAARAGEVGRGFAVVAGEVRNLAQQSEKASRNINDLIRKSSSDVNRGVTLVQEAGQALGDIAESVVEMVEGLAGIAHASSEQATGVSEIANAINEIDGATQKNLAMSESYAVSAETLRSRLQEIAQTVSVFQTMPRERGAVIGRNTNVA